jgi:anti-sigma factor RsiW
MRASLGAYALGALEPDEAAAVRRHLQGCPKCTAESESLAELPALLSLAGGAEAAVTEPLSPAFEERLLDAYARERATAPSRLRRRLRPRWLAVGVTAAVAAAAAAFAVIGLSGDSEPSRRYEVSFRNVGAPGAKAWANLHSSEGGTTVHLWVKNLPHSAHAVYEVLCDAPMWTASAGTFRTDVDGRAYVVLTTALRQGEYDAIRIVRRGHRADGRLVRRNMLTAKLS